MQDKVALKLLTCIRKIFRLDIGLSKTKEILTIHRMGEYKFSRDVKKKRRVIYVSHLKKPMPKLVLWII